MRPLIEKMPVQVMSSFTKIWSKFIENNEEKGSKSILYKQIELMSYINL